MEPASAPVASANLGDRFEDRGPLPKQGGFHKIHHGVMTDTGREVAAKQFSSDEAFQNEWNHLKELARDRGGEDFVTQLVSVDVGKRILYLEPALCSLDQQLEESPGQRLPENEVKSKITRILQPLR